MRPLSLPGLALLLLMPFLLSCARSSPTAPDIEQTAREENAGNPERGSSGRVLLGLYAVHIPADRATVEMVPDRAGVLHLNVVRMLETYPCTDCLSIKEIEVLGEGRVEVTVRLDHPFPYEHLALTGFDVRGIVMLPGSFEFPTTGVTVSREELGDPVLVGADGYTRLFNPHEFSGDDHGPPALHYIKGRYASPELEAATLNPYLVFVAKEERNHFPAGASAARTYDFKLPPGPVKFGYAVDASWYPVDGPVENVPDDFPLSANSQEAYKVRASIGKGLTPTGTGTANVMIEIFDWQGVDTIDKVLVEAPDLFTGQVEGALSTVGDKSAIYYAEIQNSLLAPIGDYPLLVTVRDTEEDPNLGPLAAYQVITAHVTLTGVWIRELVHIPAGDFIMGSDPGFDPQSSPDETPQHLHPTGEYYISKFEISNEEYAAFIADGGYFNPVYWSDEGWEWRTENNVTSPFYWNVWPVHGSKNGVDFPDYPTWGISWHEANAFCSWAGGRLPNEAEWEKAARGTDGRIWPWGNEWHADYCNCNHPYGEYEPIGSYSPQGDSPYGLADAIGNAAEYTTDWWDWAIYEQYAAGDFSPPTEPTYPDMMVIRGGQFSQLSINGYFRTASRHGMYYYIQNPAVAAIRIVFDS